METSFEVSSDVDRPGGFGSPQRPCTGKRGPAPCGKRNSRSPVKLGYPRRSDQESIGFPTWHGPAQVLRLFGGIGANIFRLLRLHASFKMPRTTVLRILHTPCGRKGCCSDVGSISAASPELHTGLRSICRHRSIALRPVAGAGTRSRSSQERLRVSRYPPGDKVAVVETL